MTTYQEPPLQSRRAARQEERADAPPTVPGDSATPMPLPPAAEPLNYSTTSRPPLPQYDGQNLRPRRTVESADQGELSPSSPLPDQDVPGYRSRDFSPEGRRAVAPSWAPHYGAPAAQTDGTLPFQTQGRDQVTPPAPAAPPLPGPTPPAPGATSTPGEHTMTRRELRALREAGLIPDDAVVSSVTGAVVPPASPVSEQPEPVAPVAPVTAESVSFAAPIEPPPALVEPAPASAAQASSRLNSALAEFDALAAGREPFTPASDGDAPRPGRRAAQPEGAEAPAEVLPEIVVEAEAAPTAEPAPTPEPESTPEAAAPSSTEGLSAFDALFQAPSAPPAAPPASPLAASPASTPAAVSPLLAPPSGPPITPPATIYPTPVDLPAPPATPTSAPSSAGPGIGHWSTQSDLDDAEQINESTISRSVGNGAITTSALVLPAVPEHAIGGPILTSGEILLTGSISLPQSLAVSGAHPSQLDESDIDHLLDPGDHQVASTDSTPVRAIRAVSTHTATGGIIAPAKPKGTRGFTILIVAASVMAVVVVGLLVAGLVSGNL